MVLSLVSHHVFVQSALLCETAVTELTPERFLARVCPDVCHHVPTLCEATVTDWTRERLVPRVDPHVLGEEALGPEAPVADVTETGFLARVPPHVRLQLIHHPEAPPADRAQERPLPGVDEDVALQLRVPHEPLGAVRAGEAAVFSVASFQGSGAGTRERLRAAAQSCSLRCFPLSGLCLLTPPSVLGLLVLLILGHHGDDEGQIVLLFEAQLGLSFDLERLRTALD